MDVDVDEHAHTGLRERAHGCGETVINHYFYLVMKMQDGCSVSLTRTGDSNYKAKNDQGAIAQEMKQFLNL